MGLTHDEKQLYELIKEHGGQLISQANHIKYRFPDGRSFTFSGTPSDHRAMKNNLRSLRNFLGVEKPKPPKKMTEEQKQERSHADHQAIMRSNLTAPGLRSLGSELKKIYGGNDGTQTA